MLWDGNYWSSSNGTSKVILLPQALGGSNESLLDGHPLKGQYVPLLGDVNNNMKVDIQDIGMVAQIFGSFLGDPRWDFFADVDGNHLIDLKDIGLIAKNFGKHYP